MPDQQVHSPFKVFPMTEPTPPPFTPEQLAAIRNLIAPPVPVVVPAPDPVVPPTPATHISLPDVPKSWLLVIGLLCGTTMLLCGVAPEKMWAIVSLVTGSSVQDVAAKADAAKAEKTPATVDQTTVKVEKVGKNPPDVVLPEATSIKPEDVKPWIDLFGPIIQQLIEQANKPKPVIDKPPVDTPPANVPPPNNVPPQNTPPVPTTLKLSVTDSTGLAMASSSVPAGKLLLIKLEGFSKGQIKWTKRPTGDVQWAEIPGTQIASIVLGAGAELDLFVTDYGIQQQVDLRVTAQTQGQPPPTNDPPVVINQPPVNVPTPGSKKFTLSIVEDPKAVRTIATMGVMNNLSARKTITDKGHVIARTVPITDSDPAAQYVKQQGTQLPALAFMDSATNQYVKAVPLPADFGVSLLPGMGG